MHQRNLILLLAAIVLSTGCGTNISDENSITTPVFITATLPVLFAPTLTATPVPPVPLPTTPPIEGTTTTQINVRAEPSTIGTSLGTIAPFSRVQILGREANGAWYQIVYVNSTDEKGWVTALYVQVDAAVEIPVIQTETGPGISGLVIQPVNIRSGPGTDFDSLGSLSTNDVITVTGKDSSGAWMQVRFATGVGWVASEFLRVNGSDTLPILEETAQLVPTAGSTQEQIPLHPQEMTFIQDNDSMHAPAYSVQLSSSGTGAVQFSGTVTAPDGDSEDWLQFRSESPDILLAVECSANGLHVELWNESGPVEKSTLSCDETRLLRIRNGETYSLRIVTNESTGLQVTSYILMLELFR